MTTFERFLPFEKLAIVQSNDSEPSRHYDFKEFESESVESNIPPIPQGTRPLQLQVAGHVFGRANGQKKNKIGFLQSDDGTVLKPVLDHKGQREVSVYEAMFSADECSAQSALFGLREFVPKFMGMWTTPVHPGQSYIRLENVTLRFQNPSVMDIKIGPITFDCEADDAKRDRELKKFPALSKVGFQILGIKRYVPETKSYLVYERTLLRTLDEHTISTEGLAKFVSSGLLVDAFLRRLKSIDAWFTHQNAYCFIASSLLFVYDSDALDRLLQLSGDGETTAADEYSMSGPKRQSSKVDESALDELVDVRVIDLTHVFPTDGPDVNYLTGLHSLISYFEKL